MSLISSITLAVLLLMNCANNSPSGALPLRTLSKGAFSGIQEASERVIKDQPQWEKTWTAHTAGRAPGQSRPEIDFAKEMVIVVTLGRKNTGGYAVEVTKAESSDGKLKIYVTRKTPRPGSMSIQALTAPFHMVAVPKTDLKPEFIEAPAAE